VYSRYTGASGATWRTSSRTSRVRLAAREDLTTYAGDPSAQALADGPVKGKYTMASPASRQSSCFTSSTTPTTVNHSLFCAGRSRRSSGFWPGHRRPAAERLMMTLLLGVIACR
jgi:hypothetical protein